MYRCGSQIKDLFSVNQSSKWPTTQKWYIIQYLGLTITVYSKTFKYPWTQVLFEPLKRPRINKIDWTCKIIKKGRYQGRTLATYLVFLASTCTAINLVSGQVQITSILVAFHFLFHDNMEYDITVNFLNFGTLNWNIIRGVNPRG